MTGPQACETHRCPHDRSLGKSALCPCGLLKERPHQGGLAKHVEPVRHAIHFLHVLLFRQLEGALLCSCNSRKTVWWWTAFSASLVRAIA